MYIDYNNVGDLESGTFSFAGIALIVSLSFNPIGSVADGAMSGISSSTTLKFTVHLNNAQITTLGAIFDGFAAPINTACFVEFTYNQIDGESLKAALNSLGHNVSQPRPQQRHYCS